MCNKKIRDDRKESTFTGIWMPAELSAMQNISSIEKIIISDIGYFKSVEYRFSNSRMAKKFGVSRRTIINAVNRLKSPKFNLIEDIGRDDFHRCLKLKGEVSALFGNQGMETTPTKRSKNFQKPTAAEVEEYAQSIGFQIDGEKFVSHYAANAWMRGKTQMRDWRAAVKYWKATEKEKSGNRKTEQRNAQAIYIR